MSLTKHQTTGPAKIIRLRRRKQKRNPRRLLEAVPLDWARWDAAAKLAGLNWSEFTRRALNAASSGELVAPGAVRIGHLHPEALSEKRALAADAKRNGKPRRSTAARKG